MNHKSLLLLACAALAMPRALSVPSKADRRRSARTTYAQAAAAPAPAEQDDLSTGQLQLNSFLANALAARTQDLITFMDDQDDWTTDADQAQQTAREEVFVAELVTNAWNEQAQAAEAPVTVSSEVVLVESAPLASVVETTESAPAKRTYAIINAEYAQEQAAANALAALVLAKTANVTGLTARKSALAIKLTLEEQRLVAAQKAFEKAQADRDAQKSLLDRITQEKSQADEETETRRLSLNGHTSALADQKAVLAQLSAEEYSARPYLLTRALQAVGLIKTE